MTPGLTRTWWLVALAVAALTAVLPTAAAAQQICELRFIPPDGAREICYSCDNPPDSQAASECASRCSDPAFRRSNPSCAFRDGDDRRNQPPKCDDDERLVNGRCEQFECPMGQRPSRGECVPEKPRRMAQDPKLKCIDQPTLNRVEMLVELAESIVEARAQNAIALAVARFLPITLPGNRLIFAGPEVGGGEEADLRESLEKYAAERRLTCQAGSIVRGESCANPLDDLLQRQEAQLSGPMATQLATIARENMGADFNACLQQRDRRTLAFNELAFRTEALNQRDLAINGLIQAIKSRRPPNSVVIECAKPDVNTCTIGLTGEPQLRPDRAAVKRALKAAVGLAETE
jgi:hypothetical protein